MLGWGLGGDDLGLGDGRFRFHVDHVAHLFHEREHEMTDRLATGAGEGQGHHLAAHPKVRAGGEGEGHVDFFEGQDQHWELRSLG